MKKTTTCCFVILGFNHPETTEECLSRFHRFLPLGGPYRVVVFDNGSTPPLRHLVKRYGAKYIRSPQNLGFAQGYNEALANVVKQHDDVICLVNNDLFIDRSFIRSLPAALSRSMKNPTEAAFQPLLFLDPEYTKPENFGITYFHCGLAFQNRTGEITGKELLNGACLFLKRTVIEQLFSIDGFVFVPEYFVNAEDAELSLRLQSRGYTLRVDPSIRAQHLGSVSMRALSGNATFLCWRNLLWTVLITRTTGELMNDAFSLIGGQTILGALSLVYRQPLILPRMYLQTIQQWRHLMRLRSVFLSQRST